MKTQIKQIIESSKANSAWSRGVKQYALDMLDDLDDNAPITEKELLNGADSWSAYSYGGCSMIYDADIAERLCSPSELKKTRNGDRQPNSRETWLDCQARALYQASRIILKAAKRIEKQETIAA